MYYLFKRKGGMWFPVGDSRGYADLAVAKERAMELTEGPEESCHILKEIGPEESDEV